jgi:diguanylate cyclase (GGDEF)-like protein/PAS domain S-box-containing protein
MPPSPSTAFRAVQARGRGVLVLTLVFVLACTLGYLVVRDAVSRTVEQQALAVAEIVAQHATTARSVYALEVAGKLTRDGFGPHVDSHAMPGYVPIPAQFLKLVARASSESSDRLYEYRPVSKWHIEPTQGLDDPFLRWAWPQLEAQDQDRPLKPIQWQPVWRIEREGGARVLRYLSADPASQRSCVSCHNAYELKSEVQALRVAAGVPAGKQWQQHQLMGALSIRIPLAKAEVLAGSQINQTTAFIFGILVASFATIFWFQGRHARQQTSLRSQELRLAQSELEARTANELLRAKQGVEQALAELSTYTRAIDQHAIVSVAGRDGRIIQVNEKLIHVSGYAESELIGQDHRILSSGLHDRAFFVDMWQTLGRGEIWRGVICNRKKTGELYWVDSAIVPLKDPQGRVMRYVSIRIDVTERMQSEQRMRHIASHDALTGLVNRAVMRERIDNALQAVRRSQAKAAVLFVDLDHFKGINDSLGHETGDRLLVEVGARLQASVRHGDTVARQGGDEFIVFMPHIDGAPEASTLAERLTHELARPFMVDGRELYIGSSIGVAIFPDHGDDVDTLLKHSDAAMYHVKESGRNRHVLFDPQMSSEVLERYTLGMELRRAIDLGEFELHYQPVIGIVSGQVEGLEALLRWRHPTRGLVSPMQFVPIAERSGLIVPIGDWVLRAACEQIRAWRAEGVSVPRIAINLSILQLQNPDIVARIDAVLREFELQPGALGFEVTEGMLMSRPDDAVEVLRALSERGFDLAIDDFGTGYSSLSYLKLLPIDTLKIDRSFVRDIGRDADSTAIVSAIVALAHSLQLGVIAEGVETPEQLDFVRAQGCQRFQGYLASRPLTADAIARRLRESG